MVRQAEFDKEIFYNKDGVYPKIKLEGFAKKLLQDKRSLRKGDKWTRLRNLAG